MKKIIVLLGIIFAGVGVAVCNRIEYKPAFAEDEPEVVEVEEPKEEIDWEGMYTKAVEKYNEIRNTQILGTTIAGLVSMLASVGVTFLFNKVSQGNIKKLDELCRETREKAKTIEQNALTICEVCGITNKELIDGIKMIGATNERLEENDKLLKARIEEEVQSRAEEREFFLTIICNSPEMVANGIAEQMHKRFGDLLNNEEKD